MKDTIDARSSLSSKNYDEEKLKDYIDQQLKKGYSEERIKQQLIQAGYPSTYLGKYFEGLKKQKTARIFTFVVVIAVILVIYFSAKNLYFNEKSDAQYTQPESLGQVQQAAVAESPEQQILSSTEWKSSSAQERLVIMLNLWQKNSLGSDIVNDYDSNLGEEERSLIHEYVLSLPVNSADNQKFVAYLIDNLETESQLKKVLSSLPEDFFSDSVSEEVLKQTALSRLNEAESLLKEKENAQIPEDKKQFLAIARNELHQSKEAFAKENYQESLNRALTSLNLLHQL